MAIAKSADDIFRSASIRNDSTETGGFNVIRYPHDLASAQHPHYVMFFINVRNSDISEMERNNIADVRFDNTGMNRPNTDGQGKMLGVIAGAQAGGSAGSGAGRTLGRLIEDTAQQASGARLRPGAQIRQQLVGGILGTVAGAVVGGVVAAATDRSQVLLKDVIALYMSGLPVASYGASWGEEDLGLVGAFGDASNPLGIRGGAEMAGALMMKGSESAGSNLIGNASRALQGTLAMTPNPFKAQLFKSMKFRTFSYSYNFLPKDENEYRAVRRIISTFKRYMHPTLGAGKFILKYPAEFSIAYYYKNSINAELFRMSNCALTDMSVEYGGSDFVTFRGSGGAPTEITMKLKFTELETLTRERFNEREF